MTVKRFFLFFAFLTYTLSCAMADKGYRISVKVDGLAEGNLLLAYHFGDRQYLKDTARMEQAGLYIFENETRLDPGMYLVVVPGQKFFEVIVDQNQHFGIETKMDEFVEKTVFNNSPDNTAFYQYLRFIREKNEQMVLLSEEMAREDISDTERDVLNEKMKGTDQEVKDKQQEYIRRFSDGLFSRVLLAQQEPPVPEPLLKEDGTTDQMAMYQIYKSKFWDNIDFSDDRLLRTPVFHNKLRQFFSNVLIQIPDSIIEEADRIVEMTRAHPEVFKYTIWFITNHFERSQIMGHDAVFVHMVESYYMSGEAFWIEPENLQRISDRAIRMKPLLIGKVAPDIAMYKPDNSILRLHNVNANFTILYFWDSECSHCKRVTPALRDLHERLKQHGVEVFSANIEAEKEDWLKAVEAYQLKNWINVNDVFNQSGFREKYDLYATPVIFLLDKDKKIMAKRITVEQVESFILNEIESRANSH